MRPELTDTRLADALRTVRAESPLVQHLTNEVTMSETANVTHAWGALPVMADAIEEAGEMAAAADAVLINTGRCTEVEVEAMVEAGTAANDAGVPVVLDPVGYGATEFRVATVNRLLSAVDVSVIKGNYGEVSGLAGDAATVRGVESVGEYAEVSASARALAAETGATVVASGEVDVVADGDATYELSVGHERLGSFVGSGCMLGSTVATFAGVVANTEGPPADPTDAALLGTAAFGTAGERAATADVAGPASYRTAFVDAVATLANDGSDTGIADRIDRVD